MLDAETAPSEFNASHRIDSSACIFYDYAKDWTRTGSRLLSREPSVFEYRLILTEIYTPLLHVTAGMTPTVHDLRNEIRTATGRFEREVSTTFTKEDLAAICDAVNYEIDTNSLPAKPQMRAGILYKIGELDDDDPDKTQNAFKKRELERIADTVKDD